MMIFYFCLLGLIQKLSVYIFAVIQGGKLVKTKDHALCLQKSIKSRDDFSSLNLHYLLVTKGRFA